MASGMLPPPPSQNSIRSRQIAALRRMLNLNVPIARNTVAIEPIWKVLIYDKYGSDIISPLLSVKELRSLGVTLHLLLESEREAISDAVAVYFVMPSRENIERICQDCKSQLYENYYFNFITPIPREMLEQLAKVAVETNSVSQISKVFDQHLNFVSLEDDLYITRHQKTHELSYYALNRTDALDTDIEMICNSIVLSLFSVFVTAGAIPIIRCPKGNAAEMIAEKLDKKIRDNLRDPRNNMFSGDNMPMAQLSFTRPLLIILDRNIDLATPLHHTWTYQALAHDVLDLELNRVRIPPSPSSSSSSEQAISLQGGPPDKTYDLLPSDKFWGTHRGDPFPTIADAVQLELNEYKSMEEEMMRLKNVMGVSEGEDDPSVDTDALSDSTAKLTSAISSLPELMDRKKKIDMHTNLATALLDQIKERKLDTFFEMEDKLITKSSVDKSLILDLISDVSGGGGTPEDKMRLFIMYFILSPDLSDADIAQFETALEGVSADTTPLNYLKKWKAFTRLGSSPRTQALGTSSSTSSMSTMFSHIMSTGSKYMEGVKNLVVGTKNFPVTRIVEQLLESKSSKVTDDYRYFDPKILRVTDSSAIPRSNKVFQEAFVYMVGGGNYIEYQNLQDYCKRQQSSKRVTYGTSELMNAKQFLSQLSELGKNS